MKKINTEGWTVKAVKVEGHTHGKVFTGNLYRGAIKIGSFEEHGRGGPMDIHYLGESEESDFLSLANLLQGEEHIEADAILIEEMVEQLEYVKRVRRERKKNTYFCAVNDDQETNFKIGAPYSEAVVDTILKEKGEITIANEEFDIYPDGVERVYRDE